MHPDGPGQTSSTLTQTLRTALRGALRDGLGEALWLFVTLRIVLSLFALIVSFLFALPRPCTWEDGPATHTTGLEFRLLGVWQHWDVCWYQRIAALGYGPGDPSVNFFPLYPLLMRQLAKLLDGDLTLAGLVLSGLAYIVAMTGLYRLVRADFDHHTARRTMLYVSIFPSGFFLFAPYTESLFLALSVWALYWARRGLWDSSGLAAFLAGLTRGQGGLLALPLAWEVIRYRRSGGKNIGPMLVPILPPLAVLAFQAYAWIVSGMTTVELQQGPWGIRNHPPWTVVAASWQHILERGDVVEATNLGLVFSSTALLAYGARRLPFSYVIYAAPQLLLISTRLTFFQPLAATSRYILVLFPLFTVLALLGRHPRFHDSWLITSTVLLALYLYGFMSGRFIG